MPAIFGRREAASRKRLTTRWIVRGLSVLAGLWLWEVYGRSRDSLLLPTASQTAAALLGLLLDAALWQALWNSNQILLIGFGLALLCGVPLGLGLGRWAAADGVVSVYFSVLLATPMAALIPVFIIAFGLNLASRALVVFAFALPFIVINTHTGVRQVPLNLIDMARSCGANELQLWRQILVPGALPGIMTGIRIGLGRAITGLVAAELLLGAEGLGRLLAQYRGDFEAAHVYALVIILVSESVLLLRTVRAVESRWGPPEAELSA